MHSPNSLTLWTIPLFLFLNYNFHFCVCVCVVNVCVFGVQTPMQVQRQEEDIWCFALSLLHSLKTESLSGLGVRLVVSTPQCSPSPSPTSKQP